MPDAQTDRVVIILDAVLKQVLSGEFAPFEFAQKMNTLCEMTVVPVKVNYEIRSGVSLCKFEVEGK